MAIEQLEQGSRPSIVFDVVQWKKDKNGDVPILRCHHNDHDFTRIKQYQREGEPIRTLVQGLRD